MGLFHHATLQQREVHNLKGHESYVFCLCTTPHSQVLISGSYDEHVRIWDLRSGSCVRTIEAHSDPVTALDTHKDGTQFVSGSHDGLLYVSPLSPVARFWFSDCFAQLCLHGCCSTSQARVGSGKRAVHAHDICGRQPADFVCQVRSERQVCAKWHAG